MQNYEIVDICWKVKKNRPIFQQDGNSRSGLHAVQKIVMAKWDSMKINTELDGFVQSAERIYILDNPHYTPIATIHVFDPDQVLPSQGHFYPSRFRF